METETTPSERAKLMAVAMLDGVGEQVERIVAPLHRMLALLAAAQGVKIDKSEFSATPSDYEHYQTLNPDSERTRSTEPNWDAMEAMGRRLAGL